MFVIPEKDIDKLSKGGLYDYFTDLEDSNKLSEDDKEEIYQHMLSYLEDNLSPGKTKEFLLSLNEVFLKKKSLGF